MSKKYKSLQSKKSYKDSKYYKAKRYKTPNLPISGFSKSHMVKLRYSTEILLNPAVGGVPVYHVFRANGIFDPDFTGVGHQPRGFDEWMAVYQHYTVVGSKCTMRWLPSSATSKVPSAYGVAVTDTTTFPHTSLSDVIESVEGGQTWRSAGGIGMASKGSTPVITRKFSAKKFFGTRDIIGEAGYKGTDAANPIEDANFIVWATGCAAAEPDALCYQVTIDYVAVLTERRGLDAS